MKGFPRKAAQRVFEAASALCELERIQSGDLEAWSAAVRGLVAAIDAAPELPVSGDYDDFEFNPQTVLDGCFAALRLPLGALLTPEAPELREALLVTAAQILVFSRDSWTYSPAEAEHARHTVLRLQADWAGGEVTNAPSVAPELLRLALVAVLDGRSPHEVVAARATRFSLTRVWPQVANLAWALLGQTTIVSKSIGAALKARIEVEAKRLEAKEVYGQATEVKELRSMGRPGQKKGSDLNFVYQLIEPHTPSWKQREPWVIELIPDAESLAALTWGLEVKPPHVSLPILSINDNSPEVYLALEAAAQKIGSCSGTVSGQVRLSGSHRDFLGLTVELSALMRLLESLRGVTEAAGHDVRWLTPLAILLTPLSPDATVLAPHAPRLRLTFDAISMRSGTSVRRPTPLGGAL